MIRIAIQERVWACEQIAQLREQLQQLRQSGEEKLSITDTDARFLRERGGFVLGYTAEIVVSEDHFIVAQRVTQNKNDNQTLVPLVEAVERQCGERPQRVLADCGFFSNQNLREMAERGIAAYVPDPNSGARIEHRKKGARSGTDDGERSASAAFAPEVAQRPRSCLVQKTQGNGRAGVRNFERTAWDATVPPPRAAGHRRRMGAGRDRLQLDRYRNLRRPA